ncbi:MAG: DNA polymerase III subunit delta [Patescibacteria group bacterium]
MLLIVYGGDAFRVKERGREFVTKFVEKYDPARMNVDEIVFSKKDDLDLPHVADVVTASPFLSDKRMVRVDGIFSFVTTKPDAEPWANVFSKIPSSTIVVLVDVVGTEKVEKIELFKRLSGLSDVHLYPISMLTGSELRTWVQQRAKTHGAVLVPDVADSLINRVGNDTWRLETEIAKLAAHAGDAPIDEDMIRMIVVSEYSEDIFGMIDSVSGGRPEFALRKLAQERSAGAEDFPLFGMFVRQIRLLLQVKALLEDRPNAGKQDIATEFGIHPFVAQKILAEAKRHDFAKIKAWHLLAAELDVGMKRGVAPEIAVDRLVAALLDAS